MSKKPQPKGPYKHYERPTTSRAQMHENESQKGGHARIWAGIIIIAIILIAAVPIIGAKLHSSQNQNIAEKSIETSQTSQKSHSKKTIKKSQKKSKKSTAAPKSVQSSVSSSSQQSSSVQSQASSSSEAKDFEADSNGNYTVQAGDTLSEIASANNTTVSNLMKLNGISKQDNVTVGQTIRVKAAQSTSSSSNNQN